MRQAQVEALGNHVYGASIHPYTSRTLKHVAIFGLDSEWRTDKKGNKLLCWQLSLDKLRTQIFTSELCWNNLHKESITMLRSAGIKPSSISVMVYSVFLATAEAQWLLSGGLPGNVSKIEVYSSHRLNIMYRIRKNTNMYLYDLSNWAQDHGLAKLAHTFGLEKLKYDVAHLTKESINDPDFIEYAKNDAWIQGKILRELREKIMNDSGIDILLSKTPANTAANHFRKDYVPRIPIGERVMRCTDKRTGEIKERTRIEYAKVHQGDACARRYALYASHGGRKEMMYRGSLPNVYEYDASSAYPSTAIQIGILPLQHNIKCTNVLNTWLNATGGWGRVRFKFPHDCTHPCLPVEENTTKIIYPLEGHTDCTNYQVRVAIEMGAEVHLVKGYYYMDGVDWLPKYLKELVDKRNTTNDPVMNELYKLMSNAIIGKLTQKRKALDLNALIRTSAKTGVPISVLQSTANAHELGILHSWKHGTLFMPEWNTLILGRYQANISRLAWKCNALQIATDAVFTTEYMGETFVHDGIVYKLEEQGEYVAYRPGLYRIGDKQKHHGGNKEAGNEALAKFLDNTDSINYYANRIVSLKQSIHSDMKLGNNYTMPQTLRLGYDGKRILYSDGTTRPLRDISECDVDIGSELIWHDMDIGQLEMAPT